MQLKERDKLAIRKLRSLFPATLKIRIHSAEEGGFFAEVVDMKGVFTQAETFSELIEMVNDVVQLMFDVPKRYASHMPFYLPSVELARKFDMMPPARERTLTLVSSSA